MRKTKHNKSATQSRVSVLVPISTVVDGNNAMQQGN